MESPENRLQSLGVAWFGFLNLLEVHLHDETLGQGQADICFTGTVSLRTDRRGPNGPRIASNLIAIQSMDEMN